MKRGVTQQQQCPPKPGVSGGLWLFFNNCVILLAKDRAKDPRKEKAKGTAKCNHWNAALSKL